MTTKKRPSDGDGGDSPTQQAKKPKTTGEMQHTYSAIQFSQSPQMGMLKPASMNLKPPRPRPSPAARQKQQPPPPPQQEQEHQPQIDPNLFSMYDEPGHRNAYNNQQYSYSTESQPQHHGLPQMHPGQYQLPSLEQIANEVLVDMNGNDPQDQDFKAQHPELAKLVNGLRESDTAPMTNGEVKPDESVDSAISIPTPEQNGGEAPKQSENEAPPNGLPNGIPAENGAHPSIEDGDTVHVGKPPASTTTPLPLWQPPPPPSSSPEAVRRTPGLVNGVGKSDSPPLKRKRDSTSATPGSAAKKAKVDGERRSRERSQGPGLGKDGVPLTAGEEKSLELAKALQAQEMGLRRRSKGSV